MLNGLNILLTRENNDNIILAEKLASLGINSFNCPLLSIVPLAVTDVKLLKEDSLRSDIIIFISKNAVKNFFSQQMLSALITSQTLVAAIGLTTKIELEGYGIKNIIYPQNNVYNSVNLFMELQQKTSLKNKSIMIVKGVGGLGELKNRLITSGAKIVELSVYKRMLPEGAAVNLKNIFTQQRVDMLLVTSEFIFNNIGILTYQQSWFYKNKICLLVPSKRLAVLSCKQGFRQVITVKNATNAAIFQKLSSYCVGVDNVKV